MTRKAAATQATRERLMRATLTLVAENGFEAATVGAIEEHAGLAPRSGALYQYFEGKDQALRAAVEQELAVMDELGSVIQMLPLGELRSELTLMARWNLASLESRSLLATLIRREARRLPMELLDEIYVRIVERPYEQVVGWLAERFAAAGASPPDLYAFALVLTEGMASYTFMRQTFGRVPDGIDDDRLIDAWVNIALAVAKQHGLDPTGSPSPGRQPA